MFRKFLLFRSPSILTDRGGSELSDLQVPSFHSRRFDRHVSDPRARVAVLQLDVTSDINPADTGRRGLNEGTRLQDRDACGRI